MIWVTTVDGSFARGIATDSCYIRFLEKIECHGMTGFIF